jgi:ParB-like chromosome segregation protein Spo0J/DNA modification methylase
MPISDQIDLIETSSILIGPDRQRSDASADDLTGSIKLYGILVPLIITRDNKLIAGHRRLLAAREAELPRVPVRYYDTLDELELKTIELEENIKRTDLPWRDYVRAVGNLHALKKVRDPTWTNAKTAEILNLKESQTGAILIVFKSLDKSNIAAADNLTHAIGILQRLAERQAASIVGELLQAKPDESSTSTDYEPQLSLLTQDPSDIDLIDTGLAFTSTDTDLIPTVISPTSNTIHSPSVVLRPIRDPIIIADFLDWSSTYSGPKFNLIHCDFPYGVNADDATIEHYANDKKIFWSLTEALTTNLDKLLSYSAHVVFWLSFEYYEQVKIKLNEANLHVINRPLIWVKSDSKGAAPGIRGTQPRHSYEIALLAYRGNRPLVRQGTDSYSAPTVSNPIHPTQKPESMLKHFFSMLVDNVTDFLDPTAGSGSSIRAAEELGARYVVGLELNAEYALAANAMTTRARDLRRANEILRQNEIEPATIEIDL